jgi:hypothetical protein
MPFVRGFLRLVDRRGRPVDPDYGIDEGEPGGGLPGEPGEPGQGLPGRPERPGQGLPWPGYPGRPGHGLPWPGRPVDPDYGIDEIPGLPGIPDQGPVLPGRPGHPIERPRLPVVGTVPLPEGEELPTGAPHEPGCLCVVMANKSRKRALAWLQGESNLPEVDPTIPAPGRPGTVGGHWVCVDADPMSHACRDSDASVAFAFVFEVDANFGKPEPKR